mgnify:CR=1 FL=1
MRDPRDIPGYLAPVRQALTQLPLPSIRLAGRAGRPRLLVTGGSQGAQALNQVAHGMVAIHNLTKLEDLASSLAKLMKQ